MAAVKIESWNQADIPSILQILGKTPRAITLLDLADEGVFRTRVEGSPAFDPEGALVARASGAVVGFALGIADGTDTGTICALMVDPDYRKQGIGSQLLAEVEVFLAKHCKEKACVVPEEHQTRFTLGIDVTSPAYLFLLNRGYRSTKALELVFDLDLNKFEPSEAIAGFIEENRRNGIEFGLCSAEHRKALDKFSQGMTSEMTGDPPYPVCIRHGRRSCRRPIRAVRRHTGGTRRVRWCDHGS